MGELSSSLSPTVTQEVAWLRDAHGVDCELVNSCSAFKLGVSAMTLGHPLLGLVDNPPFLDDDKVEVVVVVGADDVTVLAEDATTEGAATVELEVTVEAVVAGGGAVGGLSSSLSLIVITSGILR